MSLSIDDLITPATADEWNDTILSNDETLQLKVSSWQSGQPSKTMIRIMANIFAQQDAMVSLVAQGGFLDFAANGSVTYTALNGKTVTQKVTPDPSIPGENPDGTPGWLDVLASSVYDETRTGAAYASNTEYFANETSNTYGPFAVGTFHVANPTSSAGYSNVEALTIGPKNIVGGTVTGASNTGPIVITTASPHGLSGSEVVKIAGVLGNTAANGTWTITVLSGTTFSLDGSSGNAAYAGGGVVQGGDLGQVDKIIQANAVPDDITAITESSTPFNVAIVATVEVPQANVAIYAAAVQTALALYFAALPIGGISGELQYNDVIGVLFAAGQIGSQQSYVKRITTMTLNGSSANLAYTGPLYVAKLSPAPAINVVGV